MLGELVHYVGIRKDKDYFNAWHTEFIVNIKNRTAITYHQFRNIMNAMYDCRVGDPFYSQITEGLHMTTFDLDNKSVEEFVRHKCCWREEQYVIDKIYKGTIIDYYPFAKYVFVTLKKIIYLEEKSSYPEWSKLRITVEKPFSETSQTLTEGTPEFDDKYIVVRRSKQ